jgi:hypothetical protein
MCAWIILSSLQKVQEVRTHLGAQRNRFFKRSNPMRLIISSVAVCIFCSFSSTVFGQADYEQTKAIKTKTEPPIAETGDAELDADIKQMNEVSSRVASIEAIARATYADVGKGLKNDAETHRLLKALQSSQSQQPSMANNDSQLDPGSLPTMPPTPTEDNGVEMPAALPVSQPQLRSVVMGTSSPMRMSYSKPAPSNYIVVNNHKLYRGGATVNGWRLKADGTLCHNGTVMGKY